MMILNIEFRKLARMSKKRDGIGNRWYRELYPIIEKEVIANLKPQDVRALLKEMETGVSPSLHSSELLGMPIEQLELSHRSISELTHYAGIRTVGELISHTERELFQGTKHFGRKSLNEVK